MNMRKVPLLLAVALMMALAGSALALDWNNEIIDSAGYVGSYTSLALDSNDLPHISYGDLTKRDLKYTRWDGSHWQIETVDSEGAVGQGTSLALDSNDRPHISYSAYSGNELKYTYWDGSNWVIQTVDSEGTNSSLALDSQGRPHIAYNGHDRTLKYARWDGSNWLIEEISKHNYVFLSLALDSNDQPHISYLHLNYPIYQLRYARWNGMAWVIEVVDNKNRAGYNNTLKLDSHDLPHISYHANNELKYARWNGSAWVTQSIGLALHSSLALDNRDRAQISYHIDYNLKYWKHSDGLNEIIDVGGDFGWPSSLALDSNNQPHIGYYDNLYGNLKYTFAPIPSLTVCASGCDHTTIQDAINAANPDDTIEVEAGTYLENLIIDKNIILQGADQATTIIDGQAQGSVVTINPNITVRMAHVTITNGLGNNQGSGTHDGGGIFNQGDLTLWRSTISGNHVDGAGGGIWNGGLGDLTLLQSTVSNNTSPDVGGGIANIGGTLNVSKSSISDNLVGNASFDSNYSGGGIYNSGELFVNYSTIDGNMAIDQGGGGTGLGGGIYNTDGSVTMNSSTISHNLADDNGQGGGIYNTGGSVAMSNSTISNNVADDNGQGGGIYNTSATGTVSIYLSTINENRASAEGGGIYNRAGSVTLANSVVANSANGGECFNDSAASGTVNDDEFNIVEDNSCGFSGGSDPQLGPLADNGGFTFTHLPEESSPVIDHVDLDYGVFCAGSEDFINDQRGVNRYLAGRPACDAGAVEVVRSSCGGLIQEAEDGMMSGFFEIDTDSIASGGQYIHVPNGFGNRWNGPDDAHKAEYCVQVDTPGIYKLKGGIYAESGMDNSFFVKVDGSPMNGNLWDFPKNTTYQMDEVSNRNGDDPVLFTLQEGEHHIEFFLREDGAGLDQFELEFVEPLPNASCNQLVAEAETGEITGSFVIGDDSVASGGQYVHVPNGAGNSFNMPNPDQQVEYCFNVETQGTYRIKGGIYAESGSDNSFFVKVDDAPNSGYLWDFPKNTEYREDYVSDRNGADPVEVTLDAGEHTVTIFLREDGGRLNNLELELVSSSAQTLDNASPPIARGVRGTLMIKDDQGQEELDLSGINLTLIDAATGGNDYNETTQTDHLGQYYFDEMPVGEYKLSLELPEGYSSSQPTEVEVTTNADQMVDVSFDVQIVQENAIKIFLPLVIK